MSCENPTTDPDALMNRRPKFDKAKTCIKCKIAEGNIVIRHAVYCKDCFFPLLKTKFKRSLEPFVNRLPNGPRKKALNPSGNLLIGFSGGLGSTVLLDLVHKSYFSHRKPRESGGEVEAVPEQQETGAGDRYRDPRQERVWKKAAVCYVEVAGAFPGMKDRTEDIQRIVESYDDFEFVPLKIEDAFNGEWWESVDQCPSSSLLNFDISNEELPFFQSDSTRLTPLERLHTYLSRLPSPTAIPSTIRTLTRLLLLYTAHSTSSSHLLLGTSLTSLSISLIASVAMGGGFGVSEEVQEEWIPPRSGIEGRKEVGVRVVRPLRDVVNKECATWAWWNGLTVVGQETVPGFKQTIGGLTKDFIIGLERDYPSTVSAIARTCGKLTPKDEAGGQCVMCQRPAQRGMEIWKQRISVRSLADLEEAPSGIPIGTQENQPSLSPYLCYACHATMTSKSSRANPSSTNGPKLPTSTSDSKTVSNLVPLPVWVTARLFGPADKVQAEDPSREGSGDALRDGEVWRNVELGREEMRTAVKDFLLDQDE